MRESTSCAGDRGHVLDRAVEGLRVGLRGMVEAAQLPHELDGCRPDLLVGGRRLEIEQGSDVSTHGTLPIITTQPPHAASTAATVLGTVVRFRGGPTARTTTSSSIRTPPSGSQRSARAKSTRALCFRRIFGIAQQRFHEVDPGLDRDHEAGLQARPEADLAGGRTEAQAALPSSVHVMDVEAQAVPDPVRVEDADGLGLHQLVHAAPQQAQAAQPLGEHALGEPLQVHAENAGARLVDAALLGGEHDLVERRAGGG